ncbi:MAG: tetratricopeptide repeat protein, partial [Myxococcota bacterium]
MAFIALLGTLGSSGFASEAIAQESEGRSAEEREARALFSAGEVAYSAGRYEDALERFSSAYELSGRPELLYNIGLSADRLRRDEDALEAFEGYLEAVPDSPHRAVVESRVASIRQSLAERRALEAAAAESEAEAAESRAAAVAAQEAAAAAESERNGGKPQRGEDVVVLDDRRCGRRGRSDGHRSRHAVGSAGSGARRLWGGGAGAVMVKRMALVCAAAAGLMSCSETPRTQVMVFVRADDAVIARAERLEVIVRGGPPGSMLEERERVEYSGPMSTEGFPLSWPVRVAVVPAGNDADRVYEVIATAFDVDGEAATSRVRSSFLPRETLTLEVFLRESCLDIDCGGEGGPPQTCIDGTCVELTPVNPCSLDVFDRDGQKPSSGECEGFDGGGDVGPSDAGVDVGEDATLDVPIDDTVDMGIDDAVDMGPDEPLDVGMDEAIDMGPADPLETYNVAFVTSGASAVASETGLDAFDAICNAAAAEGALPELGSYIAVVGMEDEFAARSAFNRLTSSRARGWVRSDGQPIADTVADLRDGNHFYPIDHNEFGAPQAGIALTGLDGDGSVARFTCDNWTVPAANAPGAVIG